jgi:hypothetical protein
MKDNIVHIAYSKDETGPAELLGGGLARIVDPVLLGPELWQGDIVRLTHLPDDESGPPGIAQVIHRQFPGKTTVQFHCMFQSVLLTNVFAMLGGDSCLLVTPEEDRPGLLAVMHQEHVNPVLLAEAVGIPQDECDDCCRSLLPPGPLDHHVCRGSVSGPACDEDK